VNRDGPSVRFFTTNLRWKDDSLGRGARGKAHFAREFCDPVEVVKPDALFSVQLPVNGKHVLEKSAS
jgi:hypothetical protein